MDERNAETEREIAVFPRWKRTPRRRFRRAALPALILVVVSLAVLPCYLNDYRWALVALLLAGTGFGLVAWRIHSSSDATGMEVLALLGSIAVLGLYAGLATLTYLP